MELINAEHFRWAKNHMAKRGSDETVPHVIPPNFSDSTKKFHQQIPGYSISPLKKLEQLSRFLGVGAIWVKDESERLTLNSFKSLGGSFAIYQFIKKKLEIDRDISFEELISDEVRNKLGNITFVSATDGNHGRGLAWAALKLKQKAIIYVHQHTTIARIKAIEEFGAKVVVVNGTYDDAIAKANLDAQKNNWQVISDTSWDGYQEIPKWVMQGYTTLLAEAQEQLTQQKIHCPTHIFVQAGVGALAGAVADYYQAQFKNERPHIVVVEPISAACLLKSIESNDKSPKTFEGNLNTIMAGLACGTPSPLAWEILKDYADSFFACPDYVAAKGMRVYGMPLRGDPVVISGESGASTLGALMAICEKKELTEYKKSIGLDQHSQVLLINTEGNTDPDYYRKVMWEGANYCP